MDLDALVQHIPLTVEPASLQDTSSDWERLSRALHARLDGRPVQPTLAALRDLGSALRRGEWHVRALLADVGETWRAVRVESAEGASGWFGLAIDLGTTTVVAELVDMGTGRRRASRLAYNAQRKFGTDVTSRMMYAERPGALAELRQAALSSLNDLIAGLCAEANAEPRDLVAAVVGGNTVMIHLLLGLDPSSIRREPYVPATTIFPVLDATEVGMGIAEGAPLYILPAASGYVGGDVTAGLLATHIADEEPLSILIDIGTNGETVLGNREFLLAVSGSAGSAFEGCGLEWGMAAQPGAIDRVWIEAGKVAYGTIGDEPPRGICGSGLIQALGSLLQAGAIDRAGKVNLAGPGARRHENHPEIVISPASENAVGRDIGLRQGDVENLIRDKAALYAGSRVLLASAGLTFDAVDRILIAGNFGQSLEIEQAVRIGLLPDIPRERIHFIGNSSLAGARAALLSRADWRRAGEIAASITCLELTVEPHYFEEYTAALFLPHTDLSLFPSSTY
ncbi:MAG: ASKHA domain-containing protein [Chloroflexi bacterium]|nr:ASKHA domain-containing protein [Chloroflexota bacterium]